MGVGTDLALSSSMVTRIPHTYRTHGRDDSKLEKLARFGFATKGVVYFLIGGLAVMSAFGSGGETAGTKGALQTIAQQPFGFALLIAAAVGLLGYALYRLSTGVQELRGRNDAKSSGKGVGYLASGALHGVLAYTAAEMAMGASGGGGGGETWVARALRWEFGPAILGAVGFGIIIAGLMQFVKAFRASFEDEIHAPPKVHDKVVWLGRIGLAARGIVFPIIGAGLARVALSSDPSEFQGLGQALTSLGQETYGTVLLACVALGLAAYGIFMGASALYHDVDA